MIKLKSLLGKLLYKLMGPLEYARKNGAHIGDGVTAMDGCSFGSEPYLVTLEDNVRLSFDVVFITHDGGNWAFRHKEPYLDVNHFGKIVIGEYTFIGARSMIMPGVYLGKNCVVGAGSLVTKSFPDGCVIAGCPARKIGNINDYANKMKSRMPDDWDVNAYKKNKKEYLIKMIPSPKI